MAMKILIVDDDERFVNDVARKLGTTHSVSIANNARAARERLKQEKFDVVILDMNLRETADSPVDSDAFGGVKILRDTANIEASRTIFVSAYLEPSVIAEAASAGCLHLLFKLVRDKNEEAFYSTLGAYIDAIGKRKRVLRRFAITLVLSIIILIGIVVACFGYSATAGLLISTTGVVVNLLSFYPKSLR
jgi:CheY-like chemotaxis protein